MRHQPQQQQVSAAGKRERNDRGIHNRNEEEAERSQMREPMRRKRRMWAWRRKLTRLPNKNIHKDQARSLRSSGAASKQYGLLQPYSVCAECKVGQQCRRK
jgi:hypothetical protein